MDETRLSILIFCYFIAFNGDVVCKRSKHGHSRGATNVEADGGKIVGGYNTTVEKIPYQAYLLLQNSKGSYQCGGSIISETFILTAAHCVIGMIKATVRVGSTNASSGGRQYQSALLVRHPRYNSRTYDYDVALIRLSRRIAINNRTTEIVTLPDSGTSVQPNTTIRVSGWGDTSENGNLSPTLMAVEIPTESKTDCEKAIGPITLRQFCAGFLEGGKDSCQGDSGGPAVDTSNGQQVGIVSNGYGCARPGSPGIYTQVSAVRDWIELTSGV